MVFYIFQIFSRLVKNSKFKIFLVISTAEIHYKIAIVKKISPLKFFQKPKYINGIITVVGGDIFGFLGKNKGEEKSPIF